MILHTKLKGEHVMKCKLGLALGCEGMADNGECGIYSNEGVKLRVATGICIFKNLRTPRVGINAPKGKRRINPLKAAKAEARNKSVEA